jgi:hypothetical protein
MASRVQFLGAFVSQDDPELRRITQLSRVYKPLGRPVRDPGNRGRWLQLYKEDFGGVPWRLVIVGVNGTPGPNGDALFMFEVDRRYKNDPVGAIAASYSVSKELYSLGLQRRT